MEGTVKRGAAAGAIVTYVGGAVWVWCRLGRYGVLSRPVLGFMAAGWPGIAAGVAVAYAVDVVKR